MVEQPHILCVDGHNFLHRARSGFMKGDYAIIFNFFRNFRALIEQHNPSKIYFALEGTPIKRMAELPSYKANRVLEEGTPKHREMIDFHRQKNLIVGMLMTMFPVTVVRHEGYEADDVIYNLIRRSKKILPWTVASNDTDFIQLLNEFNHVKLYNPMKKTYVETPNYDYVSWKALRGDACDNIPGIPGIGDKTATKFIKDPDLLRECLSDPIKGSIFARNYDLIKFHQWTDKDAMKMWLNSPAPDWTEVHNLFDQWGFKSLLKEKTWKKFVNTFDQLWANY